VEANTVMEEVEVEAMEDEVILEKGLEEVDEAEMVGEEGPGLAETRNKAAVEVEAPEEILMTKK
jgi:hypothetical protein